MLPPFLIIFLLSCLLLSLDDAILLEELFNVGAFDFAESFLDGHLFHEAHVHVGGLLAVAQLDGGVEQVTTYTLPQTSGTPRSTFSSV